MSVDKRFPAHYPRLVGRSWDSCAREVQEILKRLGGGVDGLNQTVYNTVVLPGSTSLIAEDDLRAFAYFLE